VLTSLNITQTITQRLEPKRNDFSLCGLRYTHLGHVKHTYGTSVIYAYSIGVPSSYNWRRHV